MQRRCDITNKSAFRPGGRADEIIKEKDLFVMRKKLAALCFCAAAAAVLATGCKNSDSQETEAQETAEQSQSETQADIPQGTVTLGNYMGLEITEPSTEVTDEDVETQINYTLSINPNMIEVTDRPAQDGDVVNIDYVGLKDGEAFDGGSAEGYDLTLGSGTFIDGFEDGLIGANTGDEVSLNLTFPEDYGNADLAGQDVVFEVTVNSIQEEQEAVLDDAFVQKVSDTSTTVDEYRQEVRQSLEEMAVQSAQIEMQNQAIELAIENSTFDGLDEQVNAEFDSQLEQMNTALEQSGIALSDYAAMYGMDEDGFKDYMRSSIESSAQVTLVCQAIAEAENLQVEDSDRMEVAKLYDLESPDELVTAYGQEAVDEAARNMKVMNFLVDNAVKTPEETEAAE